MYACGLIDGTGAVLEIAYISASDAIDAGRRATDLALSRGDTVSVEMRLARDEDLTQH